MMKLISFCAILLLGISSPSTTAAIERVVLPGQSIAAKIQDAHASGDFRPRFTLNAERADSNRTNYMVRVREAMPAVTSMTTISTQNGTSIPVNEDDVATMLVGDEDGVIALISVDKKVGKVDGIIQRNGENMKFTQRGGGGKALVSNAEKFEPPAWSCGNADNIMVRRSLSDGVHDEDHDHSHHDHSDHHFDPSNIDDTIADLKRSLRGSELHLGKRRRVQGASFAHWVDIYIEIDPALCTANGEFCTTTTIGPRTVNYVNALFTGANTIYETEINTHLHVLHISLTTAYNSMTDTSTALDAMTAKFGRSSTVGWHYTSPTGIKPDLHHALLNRDLGGGRASLGVICSSSSGFGVSGGIVGNFVSMGSAAVWDMMVFMHELGHNFGSWHTHDNFQYSPRIDTCGIVGSCSSQFPLSKSATIMSYCHACNGGLGNVAYTFGGKYKGTGSRSDPNSYSNSLLAGTVSFEPRRVNANMWAHVSSRGTCTQPPVSPPPPTSGSVKPTTRRPTAKPTTRKPTTASGSAKPTTRRPTSKPTTRRPTSKPTTAPPTLSGGLPTYFPTWFF